AAASSFVWPYLNRHAPVVQNTVAPSPPCGLGSGPSCSWLGSGQVAANRSGAFWYFTKYVACCAANAFSSGVSLTPASEVPGFNTFGEDSAFICFITSSACSAGSLVKSKKRSCVYALVLMLCVIGASDRQPWASKTTPYGAVPLLTICCESASNSSHVVGIELMPAWLLWPPFQPRVMMSSRNGQLYSCPLTVHSLRIDGIMSLRTSCGMYLSHG